MKNTIDGIQALMKLENLRIRIKYRDKASYPPDYIVRLAQAEIADLIGITNKAEWVEAARKAEV